MTTLYHDDPLADLFREGADPVAAERPRPPETFVPVLERAFNEPCAKCGGSGRFRSYTGRDVGPCFECKGAGTKTFKTAPATRAHNRATVAARKERVAGDKWEAFAEEHPAEAAWILANPGFEFAVSLKGKVEKWGALTDGQMAAVHKCLIREEERALARAGRIEKAPDVNVEAIEAALNRALVATGKRPKMFINGLKFKFAPNHGVNAGAVYVTEGEVYLGKIKGGKFYATREAPEGTADRLIEIAKDPKAAAEASMFNTKLCACCGRLLTDPNSVALGIGPICAKTFACW